MSRDRNEKARSNDRLPPEAVLEEFFDREDIAQPLTATDVSNGLGIARRTAHNKLNALVERGVLDTRKIGARARVWWMPIRRETAKMIVVPDIKDADLPGSGETARARKEALIAIVNELREEGSATANELKELVDPEEVNYESVESFWSNMQSAGILSKLPIETPGHGRRLYIYDPSSGQTQSPGTAETDERKPIELVFQDL